MFGWSASGSRQEKENNTLIHQEQDAERKAARADLAPTCHGPATLSVFCMPESKELTQGYRKGQDMGQVRGLLQI